MLVIDPPFKSTKVEIHESFNIQWLVHFLTYTKIPQNNDKEILMTNSCNVSQQKKKKKEKKKKKDVQPMQHIHATDSI